jgi:glutaredoxin 3|tara:strand:- start:1819 stop:2112 length:294 start_codon:yes stop_codon:yes gene_type:complete
LTGNKKNKAYIYVMKNITMYSGPLCNFCEAAKRLFLRNNLEFKELDISTKDSLREEMIQKSNGRRTIPQIFFEDQHIGGYQELRALEKDNKLKDLLK